jgi:YfiH family protein
LPSIIRHGPHRPDFNRIKDENFLKMSQFTRLNPLTSKALEQTGIRHAFFTREGGVSEGVYRGLNGGLGSQDEPDRVIENRRRMAQHFGSDDDHLLSLYQIHSSDAVIVENIWELDQRPRADAMATRVPGLILAIGTADCGPVLFADKEAQVIGAAHAGWKGAFTGVLEATLEAMESLGAKKARIIASLGPTIRQASYEVDSLFRQRFIDQTASHAEFFIHGTNEGKFQFDLPAFIGHRLKCAGIGHFDDLGLCTYQDDSRFFSFRRTTHRSEPDYGRLISAIMLDPQ